MTFISAFRPPPVRKARYEVSRVGLLHLSWQQLPPVTVAADTARDTADRVLSGRAYLEAAKPPSLRERFFSWLGEIFTDLLRALTSTGGRGLVAWIIIGIFGLAIVLLLWRFLRTFDQKMERVKPVREQAHVDITENLSAEQWLAKAAEAEHVHDWPLALRCRHRALVTELIHSEAIASREGQTAGEISTELGAQCPNIAAEMEEATTLFKDAWYGWSTPGPVERDRFVDLADRIIAGVEAHRKQAVRA